MHYFIKVIQVLMQLGCASKHIWPKEVKQGSESSVCHSCCSVQSHNVEGAAVAEPSTGSI